MPEVEIICGDAVLLMRTVPHDAVVITDPPYNVGLKYDTYSDSLKDEAYHELLRIVARPPSVVIHYPEDMFVVSMALGELPEKCVAWVYNAHTPRKWRLIAWFGCRPNLALLKQPYKNPTDKRIRKKIEAGSLGCSLYDWWEVQQVKNVSKEKTEHPCQIPLEVMSRIVGITEANLIVDPFLGSGTTAVAAALANRKFMGFDVSEKYCQIARDRLAGAFFRRAEILEGTKISTL